MKRFLLSLTACLLLVLPWLSSSVYAASATLYLTPATANVNQGSNFTVTIYENSGPDSINAVQADINYSTSQLQYVTYGNTPDFQIDAQDSASGGVLRIARGTCAMCAALTGPHAVATVTFKALAGGTMSALSFANSSAVVTNTTPAQNILTSTTGGTYSLIAPPVPPAPPPPSPPPPSGGGTSTKKKTTTKSTTKTTTPAKDTTAPKISSVVVSNVSYNSVQISWTTNEPASSEIDYGLNPSYGFSSVDLAQVTSHKVTLKNALISPGYTYHFVVKATDKAGNKATSTDSSFNTKGANVLVTVLNQKNSKPVEGATVQFGNSKAQTDAQGQATIKDLPAGNQTGSITYKDQKTAIMVVIDKSDINAPPKAATFKIKVPQSFPWLLVIIPVVILALAAWWFVRKRGSGTTPKPNSGSPDSTNQPPMATPPDNPQTPQPPPTVIQPTIQ